VTRPATKADLAEARLELSRDIANLAKGIGDDVRAIRADISGLRQDFASLSETVAGLRQDFTELSDNVAEIRRLLERRRGWWPL